MLVLSRQRDESLMLGDNVEIIIVDVRGDTVRLGIIGPKDMPVHRREIYDAIQREKSDKIKQSIAADETGRVKHPGALPTNSDSAGTSRSDDPHGRSVPTIIPVPIPVQKQQERQSFYYDVFISFATKDKIRAYQVCKALEAKGLRCFMSHKELTGGDNFGEAIRNALVASREVCLLFTPRSSKSEWVLTEWGAAWALNKRIVPILHRMGVSALPERLRSVQALRIADIDRYVSEVVDRIRTEK